MQIVQWGGRKKNYSINFKTDFDRFLGPKTLFLTFYSNFQIMNKKLKYLDKKIEIVTSGLPNSRITRGKWKTSVLKYTKKSDIKSCIALR